MPDNPSEYPYPQGFGLERVGDRAVVRCGNITDPSLTAHQLRRLGTDALELSALMLSGTLDEDPAMDEPFLGGWAEIGSAKKFHWYDGARRSLCGKWTAPFAPVAAFEHDAEVKKGECTGCRKKLDQQLARLALAAAIDARAKQLHYEHMIAHGSTWSDDLWAGLTGAARRRYIVRAREQIRAEQQRAEAAPA